MIFHKLKLISLVFSLGLFQMGCDNGMKFSSIPAQAKAEIQEPEDSSPAEVEEPCEWDPDDPVEDRCDLEPEPPVEPEPPQEEPPAEPPVDPPVEPEPPAEPPAEPPVEPEPPREEPPAEPPVEPEPPREEPPAEPPVEPEPPVDPPVEPEPPREEPPVEPPVEPEPPRENYIEEFAQEVTTGQVDILFLLDNSLSMRENNKRLSDRFSSLASVLEGVDWQMAFTTVDSYSDTNERGRHGKIEVLPGTHDLWLTPQHPRAEQLFKAAVDLDPLPQCKGRGNDHWGRPPRRIGCFTRTEEPLKSMAKAVLERNYANRGFFRSQADLAVVVISDEDERSTGRSKHATKPAEVIKVVQQAWGGQKQFSVHGIIVEPGDKACLKKNRKKDVSYYGTHVDKLAELTNGSTASICQNDYSQTMRDIGHSVKRELLHQSFTLKYLPRPNSVRVELTPEVDLEWIIDGQELIFSEKPPEGTLIKVIYTPDLENGI